MGHSNSTASSLYRYAGCRYAYVLLPLWRTAVRSFEKQSIVHPIWRFIESNALISMNWRWFWDTMHDMKRKKCRLVWFFFRRSFQVLVIRFPCMTSKYTFFFESVCVFWDILGTTIISQCKSRGTSYRYSFAGVTLRCLYRLVR